jgi:uncharacterized DUF497 family protein
LVIGDLEWDDENVEHIARHNVSPEEVEDICYGFHLSEKAGGGRYVLSGQSSSGRYLNVVIERIGRKLFRTITAFEMSDSYKRKYRKRLSK